MTEIKAPCRGEFPVFRSKLIRSDCGIDLVTVFDAILTSRQACEKLQCLCQNLMSNNFRKTAVLTKKFSCKLKLQSKDCPKKFLRRT